MRRYHRWITAIAMVFLLYVSITGVLLAIDFVTAPDMGPPPGSAPMPARDVPGGAPLPLDRLEQWTATSLATALNTTNRGTPRQLDLQLRLTPTGPLASMRIDGRNVEVDPISGATRTTPPALSTAPRDDAAYIAMRQDLHELLQHLHRGSFFGIPGQVIDVLTGLCLVFLSISGIVMYVQMLGKRRAGGRDGWFWK